MRKIDVCWRGKTGEGRMRKEMRRGSKEGGGKGRRGGRDLP